MDKNDSSTLVSEQDDQLLTAVLFALIPIVIAFVFIIFVFYRKKREAYFKQAQAELNLKIAQVEIKALRSQINPHFIFNCLNSIHHYMHRNDIKLAGDYLIKFSQLIRYVLETSSQQMVSLTDDLEALKIYMDLEQLRMAGSFRYDVDTNGIVDTNRNSINIPPMMLQPFVENSIWHGLNQKADGEIKIKIKILDDDLLECIIEDNGLTKTIETSSISSTIKKTSLGMALIKERLEVVNRLYNVNATFRIEDRADSGKTANGKRVTLILPYES